MCGPKFCSMHINRAVEEFNQKLESDRKQGKRTLDSVRRVRHARPARARWPPRGRGRRRAACRCGRGARGRDRCGGGWWTRRAIRAARDPVLEELWTQATAGRRETSRASPTGKGEGARGARGGRPGGAHDGAPGDGLRAGAGGVRGAPVPGRGGARHGRRAGEAALDSAIDLAARPRRAIDPEDAAEMKAGCDSLLALADRPQGGARTPRQGDPRAPDARRSRLRRPARDPDRSRRALSCARMRYNSPALPLSSHSMNDPIDRSSLPSVYASEDYLVQLLAKAVAAKASDIHLKVGQPPGARIRGDIVYFRAEPLTPADTHFLATHIIRDDTVRLAARRSHGVRRGILGEGGRALPREHLPAARVARDRDAHDPVRHPDVRGARRADGVPAALREGARARARRRRGGEREELDDRRDDRPPEPDAGAPHRDGRGPNRVPPPRRQGERQPARGRHRHAQLRRRATRRAAAGPGRDPRRRDPRRRDDGHRAQGGGDGPPRPLVAPHARRDRAP